MKRHARAAIALALLSMLPSGIAVAGELGGSMASMRRQYQVAKRNDYTFLRTASQVREFVRKDRLEPLVSNRHLIVNRVSFPYARPAVVLFVERLAEQYYAATGDRLVVTSLTRPLSRQPRNAHRLSVHPTGMAVDLRRPKSAKGRRWLESTLLSLESSGVLDATRERKPPHYHVAVFPTKYEAYVDRLMARATHAAGGTPADALARSDTTVIVASLEPSDSLVATHHTDEAFEPQPVPDPIPAVPLFAALGLTGAAAAGAGYLRRRSNRKQ